VNLSANAPTIPSVLKPFGTVVVYGSDEPVAPVPAVFGIVNSISYRFFIVYDAPEDWRRLAIAEIAELLEGNRLIHTIGQRFPLDRMSKPTKRSRAERSWATWLSISHETGSAICLGSRRQG